MDISSVQDLIDKESSGAIQKLSKTIRPIRSLLENIHAEELQNLDKINSNDHDLRVTYDNPGDKEGTTWSITLSGGFRVPVHPDDPTDTVLIPFIFLADHKNSKKEPQNIRQSIEQSKLRCFKFVDPKEKFHVTWESKNFHKATTNGYLQSKGWIIDASEFTTVDWDIEIGAVFPMTVSSIQICKFEGSKWHKIFQTIHRVISGNAFQMAYTIPVKPRDSDIVMFVNVYLGSVELNNDATEADLTSVVNALSQIKPKIALMPSNGLTVIVHMPKGIKGLRKSYIPSLSSVVTNVMQSQPDIAQTVRGRICEIDGPIKVSVFAAVSKESVDLSSTAVVLLNDTKK